MSNKLKKHCTTFELQKKLRFVSLLKNANFDLTSIMHLELNDLDLVYRSGFVKDESCLKILSTRGDEDGQLTVVKNINLKICTYTYTDIHTRFLDTGGSKRATTLLQTAR